ncbi:MAG: hypothetical protein H0V51_21860 [Chloroflexi bacterium]|nr:hypothetical protein [Chloroflexota bacterium]
MSRRRLIFFTRADPVMDPGPAEMAYDFATVAARAGLEAEVRLAGDAVKVALPDGIVATPEASSRCSPDERPKMATFERRCPS